MDTFVGDTIDLVIDAGIDLSGYSDLYILFLRPNRTMGHWVAAIDPGDNTRMIYTTDENDLNIPGTWVFEARAVDTGIDLHGKPVELVVADPISDTSSPPTTMPPTTSPP